MSVEPSYDKLGSRPKSAIFYQRKIHLPDSVVLYGPINLSKHNQVLSLALLVAKYFIYICNLAEDPLLLSLFKSQFRENILTERYIAMKNKTIRFFNNNVAVFDYKIFRVGDLATTIATPF